jgi:Uma2 family endonuclease
MIASKSRGPYFTPEEYLQLEKESAIKHEYRQGLVFAMAGAKKAHITIVGNLSGLLFNHFRNNEDCTYYANDMKVQFLEGDVYYYPDVVVTCDERDQPSNDVFIRHPKVIVEVLSDSTEAFDRGDKFADYKTIPELEEYVLIHQHQILVERFWRRASGLWLAQTYQAGTTVELVSIGFSCSIEALYEKVGRFLKESV